MGCKKHANEIMPRRTERLSVSKTPSESATQDQIECRPLRQSNQKSTFRKELHHQKIEEAGPSAHASHIGFQDRGGEVKIDSLPSDGEWGAA